MSFPAGSRITTVDGFAAIENVSFGRLVLGYNEPIQGPAWGVVKNQTAIVQPHMCKLSLDGLEPLQVTDEHQLLTVAGWKSLNPAETLIEHPTARGDYARPAGPDNVLQALAVGDALMTLAGAPAIITAIDKTEGAVQTYHLSRLSGLYAYFCDGFIAMAWAENLAEPHFHDLY